MNLLSALFTFAMTSSSNGGDPRNVLGLLCVWCMVLHGSPKNVARVAHDGVNVQFVRLFKLCTKHVTDFLQLVELISQSSNDPMVQGVAAFCWVYVRTCTYFKEGSSAETTNALWRAQCMYKGQLPPSCATVCPASCSQVQDVAVVFAFDGSGILVCVSAPR